MAQCNASIRRVRQEDPKFKANMYYIVEFVSKNKIKTKQKDGYPKELKNRKIKSEDPYTRHLKTTDIDFL